MSKTIVVTVEWPTGHEVVEVEVRDEATDADMEEDAADTFFGRCTYGWEVKPQ